MNYMDKINIISDDYENNKFDEYLVLFLLNKTKPEDKFRKYNNTPNSYKNFTKLVNGAEFGAVRFLSLKDNSDFETIESVIKDYDEIYSELGEENPFYVGSGKLPIALDSGGNVIYLNNSGEVWIFYNDGGDYKFIANSFEEFMDDVIFGEKYSKFFSKNGKWYQYLKLKGWVKD